MDTLLHAIQDKKNVAITSMYGLERSRFFLRCSFNLLAKHPLATIYHVLDKDRLVDRAHHEATLMPFDQFGPDGISIAKLESGTQIEGNPRLIICSVSRLFEYCEQKKSQGVPQSTGDLSVIFFDVTTLESLEGAAIERLEQEAYETKTPVRYYQQLKQITHQLCSTSIVLACNGPLDGIEPELGFNIESLITKDCLSSHHQTSGSVILRGPQGTPMIFGGLNHPRDIDPETKQRLYSETGVVLESLSAKVQSGGIIIFFPTYGRMVEYHNAWRQLGVFERIGVPYGRENRGGDHFKRGLHELATQDKSIFLCSIRYHQDDDLAEMVLGQVQLVLIVGLPYPIMGGSWDARIKDHDEKISAVQVQGANPTFVGLLGGAALYKSRAIDFLNGIIKRCLVNGYRSRPCNFYMLDQELEDARDKLAKELGDVSEWSLNLS